MIDEKLLLADLDDKIAYMKEWEDPDYEGKRPMLEVLQEIRKRVEDMSIPVDKELEQAAQQYDFNHDGLPWGESKERLTYAFKAGAQWQKEQMMQAGEKEGDVKKNTDSLT